MTTICCISDLHGNLPEIPDCDLLCIAGDIVPLWAQNDLHISAIWLDGNFRNWLDEIKRRKIEVVGIAGNHDWIFEIHPNILPHNLSWVYLQDNHYEWNELKIWGTPWQPTFYDWAFNLDEEFLETKWDLIPQDTDIIIVHGSPYMHGDKVFHIRDGQEIEERVGSASLLRKILEIKPKLVVCGHIHSGYGIYQAEETTIINCSLVNESYKPVNYPVLWEIPQ